MAHRRPQSKGKLRISRIGVEVNALVFQYVEMVEVVAETCEPCGGYERGVSDYVVLFVSFTLYQEQRMLNEMKEYAASCLSRIQRRAGTAVADL